MTLEVDNRIGHSTLPVGNEGGTAFFGSYNAGITRPVHLYTTPAAYIADIALAPAMDGTLDYKINTIGDGLASIEILNDEGKVVADGKGESGTLHVEDPHLWQHRPRNVHRGISGGILQNHQRLP